jgi:hypothetical protein
VCNISDFQPLERVEPALTPGHRVLSKRYTVTPRKRWPARPTDLQAPAYNPMTSRRRTRLNRATLDHLNLDAKCHTHFPALLCPPGDASDRPSGSSGPRLCLSCREPDGGTRFQYRRVFPPERPRTHKPDSSSNSARFHRSNRLKAGAIYPSVLQPHGGHEAGTRQLAQGHASRGSERRPLRSPGAAGRDP